MHRESHTVEAGHANVGKHKIKSCIVKPLDGLGPVFRLADPITLFAQKMTEKL
jgi:hypothetical protein